MGMGTESLWEKINMELRTFAERVLLCESLETKLELIRESFTDAVPGVARRPTEPSRSSDLLFAPRRAAPSMPHPTTFAQPRKRAIAHHILANHELQALEVMAWVLLAFPEAPCDFRLGLATVMADEQRHTRMHAEQAEALGIRPKVAFRGFAVAGCEPDEMGIALGS